MQWRQSHRTQRNSTCTENQEKGKHFQSQAHSDASCPAFLPRHFTYLHPVFQLQKQRISSYQVLLQSPSSTLQCAICESTIIPQVAHSTFWEGEHMAHAVLLSLTAVLPFPAVIYSGSGMIQLTSTVSITQNGENPELSFEQYIRKNKKNC